MKQLFLFFAIISSISCHEKENLQNYDAQNDAEIQDYIDKYHLNAIKTESGLQYVIKELGEGNHANKNSTVTVKYKGTFTNGKIFDQSKNSGLKVNLNNVIPGWTEGIPYFKEGGKGILLIPSRLGYGNKDKGPIPAGSVLIFDIKILNIHP